MIFERTEWIVMDIDAPIEGPFRQFTNYVSIDDQFPEYGIGVPVFSFVYTFGQLRQFVLKNYELPMPGEATVETDGNSKIHVRSIRESDGPVVRLGSTLPIPVIMNYLNGGAMPEELKALVDDNGYVVTMFLASEAGLFVRFSGAWHALPPTDPSEVDPIDGLNVVDVTDDALAVFDLSDLRGEQPSISMMPLAPGEDIGQFAEALLNEANQAQRTTDQAAEETVVASGMVPIRSAADLDDAIAIAEQDDTMRWYVERRARALGLEDQLPWGDDA